MSASLRLVSVEEFWNALENAKNILGMGYNNIHIVSLEI